MKWLARNMGKHQFRIVSVRGTAVVLALVFIATYASTGTGNGGENAPPTAGTLLDRGIMFAMEGDYEKAIEEFTEAITLEPDLHEAYMLRGRALVASVSDVIRVDENFSGILIFNFKTSNRERQAGYERAMADFSQAIKLEPNSAQAYRERGVIYQEQGDSKRANADYSQAIKLDPNDTFAYIGRGLTYGAERDFGQSMADLNQAIKLDPNDAFAYIWRGTMYSANGDLDQGIVDFNQAIILEPNNDIAYALRGFLYAMKGEDDRAIADLNQVIRINPNFAGAYSARGSIYADKGDYDRAIADFNQALKLAPDNSGYKTNLENARKARGY
jgi:tetratricopeptide (TPR) repeat protein